MSDITSKSTKQSETVVGAEFKPLGPAVHFSGDEVIVMRCAEIISEVFSDWTKRANLSDRTYYPFDVASSPQLQRTPTSFPPIQNTPIELPRRPQMQKSYSMDPPITETGKVATKMMAREMCDRRAVPSIIFCSPDFASVETAHLIHSYIGEKCGKIRIEPELSSLHKASHVFFDADNFTALGYDIDTKAPLPAVSDGVSLPELASRVKRAVFELTSKHKNPLFIVDPLSMLIISSLVFPVKLRSEPSSLELERLRSVSAFPSLANFTCVRAEGNRGMKTFELGRTSLRPLTFTGFSNEIDLD